MQHIYKFSSYCLQERITRAFFIEEQKIVAKVRKSKQNAHK